jgi:hypothetical protein
MNSDLIYHELVIEINIWKSNSTVKNFPIRTEFRSVFNAFDQSFDQFYCLFFSVEFLFHIFISMELVQNWLTILTFEVMCREFCIEIYIWKGHSSDLTWLTNTSSLQLFLSIDHQIFYHTQFIMDESSCDYEHFHYRNYESNCYCLARIRIFNFRLD